MRTLGLILLAALGWGYWYAAQTGLLPWREQNPPSLENPSPLKTTESKPALPTADSLGPAVFMTSQSCAATACHGAIIPATDQTAMRRDEYHVWYDLDPHANAHRVLGNAVSQRLVELLVGPDAKPADYRRVYRRCLACHGLTDEPRPTQLETAGYFELHHEGVGCEACHGASSHWIDRHYHADWANYSRTTKERVFGLMDVKTLRSRAAICARCHVGNDQREVDHDLIAAGHPMMKFELAGYHSTMPAHWNDARERQETEAFQAQLWATGQLVTAEAALALLQTRANRAAQPDAGQVTAWPEFSEYDCFACHHDLASSRWRQERGFARSGKRVTLPWGVWPFAIWPKLATNDPNDPGREFFQALAQLETTMQSGFHPEATRVAKEAGQALKALTAWADKSQQDQPPLPRELINRFLAHREQLTQPIATWDQAVQIYLAASAIARAEADERRKARIAAELPPESGSSTPLEEELRKIQRDLNFPKDRQSPASFPQGTQSTQDVRPPLRELLKTLQPQRE